MVVVVRLAMINQRFARFAVHRDLLEGDLESQILREPCMASVQQSFEKSISYLRGIPSARRVVEFSGSHDPSEPITRVWTWTWLYASCSVSQVRRPLYFCNFSALALANASAPDSYATVTSTTVVALDAWLTTTRSGRRLAGENAFSTKMSFPWVLTALTRRFRMPLCLSLMRPTLGVQAFKTCPSVSLELHFLHAVEEVFFMRHFIVATGRRLSLARMAKR